MLKGRRRICLTGILLSYASVLGAQEAPVSATHRAPVIDPAELRRHIGVIADDSMGGRDTPSPGLERTAQYVAEQFQALGLVPAGELIAAQNILAHIGSGVASPWLQRYPVPGTLRASSQSTLGFTVRLARMGKNVVDEQGASVSQVTPVSFAAAARFAADTLPESAGIGIWTQPVQTETRVLVGRHTAESAARAALPGSVVLYVPPAGGDTTAERAVVHRLAAMSHVVVLAAEDSATFAARRAAMFERPPLVLDRMLEGDAASPHWVAYVWSGALADFLRTAGLDLTLLRVDTVPHVVTLPAIGVALQLVTEHAPADTATAMNVAAILPGTDTLRLRRSQYIVVAAHMDHTGRARDTTTGQPGGIANGANDNASGVAGLLALAKAFSQPGARLKRPLLFVVTSGGAENKRQWGANAYAMYSYVGFPLNLTLDMLGSARGDSLIIDGLSDFVFATSPAWVAAQHAELGIRLVDGGPAFSRDGDHLPFLQRGIPSLYVHAGEHGERDAGADRRTARDTPDAVDVEREAQRLRLLYYVMQGLDDAVRLPAWSSAGRVRWAQFFGR